MPRSEEVSGRCFSLMQGPPKTGPSPVPAIRILLGIICIASLNGCASTKPTVRIVRITNDTYCLNTERQTYSTKDTFKTIDGVRRSERKRTCLCQKPKPKGC